MTIIEYRLKDPVDGFFMGEPHCISSSTVSILLFSREEERKHIHVHAPDGTAKFWIEPGIELASSKGLRKTELSELENLIRSRINEITETWDEHFRC